MFQGHLSIVNSTLIHPVLPIIATAGIERHVLLHSPTPNTPWGSNLPLTPTTTRPLPNGGPTAADPSVLRLLMRLSTIIEADESMGEDARSIAYFDMYVTTLHPCFFMSKRTLTGPKFRILQREGERDLFTLRQPAMPSDDDADDGYEIEMDDDGDA
jgi:hypothetical protein